MSVRGAEKSVAAARVIVDDDGRVIKNNDGPVDEAKPPVPHQMANIRYGHVWHHELKRFGLETGGKYPNERILSLMHMPDLNGKSVLDVGCFDGFYSFEALRQGASRIVALDHPNWGAAGHPPDSKRASFDYACSIIDPHGKIEPKVGELPFCESLFDEDETFDVVIFAGVLYHLPLEHAIPTLKFLNRRMHPKSVMILETSIADELGRWPSITTYPCGFFNDATNHIAPNAAGLGWMLDQAGFHGDIRYIATWADGYCGLGTCRMIFHVMKGC